MPLTREDALQAIRDNIERHGFRIYGIVGGNTPRYYYTIGLYERAGFELILAGHYGLLGEDVRGTIHAAYRYFTESPKPFPAEFSVLQDRNRVRADEADPSWSSKLILGAMDHYDTDSIRAVQLSVLGDAATIDTPTMTEPYDPQGVGAWKWLTEPWPYAIPERSEAVTDISALRGHPVTEACRWEPDCWELFAQAPPRTKSEMRIVPIDVLNSSDPSLAAVLELEPAQGLWRTDGRSPWHEWRKRDAPSQTPS